MQAEREVVRFLSAYQAIWHAHFPSLFRRAQWHIVTHLCTSGRQGAAVGELYGLVKQVFLLDDSTVKERILEIREHQFCVVDPANAALSARSVVVPTPALLEQFDRHLLALAKELCATAAALDATVRRVPPSRLDGGPLGAEQRGIVLQSLACCREPWRAALERIFDASNLSRARRIEAIRHLSSLSHGALLHMAVELRYGVAGGAERGVLADQMAASLLNLTGQNFQTTRDHIAYLIALGLLERQPGKSLRVALSERAAVELHQALGIAAAALPEVARRLAAGSPEPADDPEIDATLNLSAVQARQLLAAAEPRHHLVIVQPESAARRVALAPGSLTIGRAPPSTLLLESVEVSRTHCRVDVAGDDVSVTDLNSTNGTFLDDRRLAGTAPLAHGALLRIGNFVLTCEHQSVLQAADADSTQRRTGFGDVALLRSRRGRSR